MSGGIISSKTRDPQRVREWAHPCCQKRQQVIRSAHLVFAFRRSVGIVYTFICQPS